MDRLWAPWRNKYITAKKVKRCVFCHPDKYMVFKNKYSLCMLNIFPYNNGHLLVAPRRHLRDISQLKKIEDLDLFASLHQAKKLLNKVLRPHGYNIGINLGEAAGAGIAGHLHIHIVPRWRQDANFMPVVAKTKVISQSLDELLKLLRDAQKNKTNKI